MDLHVNLFLKFLITSILLKSNSALCTNEKRYDETDAAVQQNITKTKIVCCEGYVEIQEEFNEVVCYPECKNCLQGYCVANISRLSNKFNEMVTAAPLTSNEISSGNSTVQTDVFSLYTSMIFSPAFFIIRMILMFVNIALIIKIEKIQTFQINTDLLIENVSAVITTQPETLEPQIMRDLPPIPDNDDLYDDLVVLKAARPTSDGYMPMSYKPMPPQSTYTEIV